MKKSLLLPLFIIALLIVVAFTALKISTEKTAGSIDSYEACVAAGYPVLESYPEQCNTPNGGHFVRDLNKVVPPVEIGCTLEAMICPDGSSVGRGGPNCEFSPCPGS